MRIISQDGTYDFNYDLISLHLDGSEIYANFEDSDYERHQLASYSTPELAAQAFEKLHTAYKSMKSLKNGVSLSYVEFPKVWRFPADSEV